MSKLDIIIGLIASIGESLVSAGKDLEELKRELREHPEFDSSATDFEWDKSGGE